MTSRILVLVSFFLLASCGKNSWLTQKIRGKRDKTHYVQKPDACSRPGVTRIERKISSRDGFLKSFNYAVQYLPPKDKDAPTVVYIPGGPGQTSIGDDERWLRDLPKGYGLMLTDPRGVGCNAVDLDKTPISFFTSEEVANDVVAAVQELGAKNVILYGISYGTVVATIAGSKLPNASAVVLEGTLGRAFKDDAEAEGTYKRLWLDKLAKLESKSSTDAASFKNDPLPLGFDKEKWLSAIRTGLMLGSIKVDSEIIDVVYTMLEKSTSTDLADQSYARNLVEGLSKDDGEEPTKGRMVFYTLIACQEIWKEIKSADFTHGSFIPDGEDICKKHELELSNAYDSKNWQIQAPVYYLQGMDDPATPTELARYHYDQQRSSKHREMLIIKEGGHNPVTYSLEDCNDQLWENIAGGKHLTDILPSCEWKPGFEHLK